jgi:hypothetical protein
MEKNKNISSKKLSVLNVEKLNECVKIETISDILKEIKMEDRNRKKITVNMDKHQEILVLRKEIIDWLSKVCESLDQSDLTFYLSVEIFDRVLNAYDYNLSLDDAHFCSIISLFIASKSNEPLPIRMDTLINEVGHKKFNKNTIVSGEILILKKLNFKLPKIYFLDFLNIAINLNYDNNKKGKASHELKVYKNLIFQFAKKCLKFLIFNFNFIRSASLFTLYSSILFYSILQVEEYTRSYNILILSKYVNNLSCIAIKSEELLKIIVKINEQRKSIEDEKEYFPFINNEMTVFVSKIGVEFTQD